jgi:hypothetical protein
MQSSLSSTRTFITPSPTPEPPKPKRTLNVSKLKANLNLPWAIVIVLTLFSLFLLTQYHDAQAKLKAGTSSTANAQTSALVAKVRKLVVLPEDETPTVATVVSADKLKSQTFFANASNGDKVLVYSKEKEAILYRPSTNQIVTIAPVNVTSSGASSLTNQ